MILKHFDQYADMRIFRILIEMLERLSMSVKSE